MKSSKVIVLFSTFVIPTLILSNASKANACHPQNPFCQRKEISQKPLSRAESEAQPLKKQARNQAKANAERAELIIKTIQYRSDVRKINLKTDSERKLTGICYEEQEKFSYTQVYRDNANHPNAYTDGYREGRMNAQRREKYAPRTGGGEFSRGFDDGYYGKESTGQNANATVNDRSEQIYKWNEKCQELAEKEFGDEKAFDQANASTEKAKLIIEILRVQNDVRDISLQTDVKRQLTGVCYEQKVSHTQVSHDNANHPNAYIDGYREGRMNAQRREKYAPRTGGGEFSRGFDDGYYGKESTGQNANATVKDRSEQIDKWNKKCDVV
jgi:hypothetical protein